jgi:MSHA biogenesis protein MshN
VGGAEMSLINQVLNQLEQRGEHTAAVQPMVRAVLNPKRNFVVPLLVIGLILIAGIGARQWLSSRKPIVPEKSVELKVADSLGSGELDKLTPQQQSVAMPVPGVLVGNMPAVVLAPASRLSFELSSVPLPSSLRQGSAQALRNEKNNSRIKAAPAIEPGASTRMSAAQPQPIPSNTAPVPVAAQASIGAVPIKQVSSAQQADAEFRRAAGLMQLGRIADAIAGYETALRLDAGHDAARQALVALLLEGKRNADAEKVLLEGLNNKPEHTGLTMLLARLQVERGALEQATATLEKSLPFADTQADYRAFLAALLQRQNRNEEAIKHYQIVLQSAPNNGVWLMGYGISLQAVQRNAEAKDAFRRALDTKTLSPELQAFVQHKLNGL